MTDRPKQPNIDWEPAPGVLLCKPLKREELAALYNRKNEKPLFMPDKVGKVSDSVGVGQVLRLGPGKPENIDATGKSKAEIDQELKAGQLGLKPGDYVAWMPFTDQLIEIDGQKYSLVGYNQIRAIRKGDSK